MVATMQPTHRPNHAYPGTALQCRVWE